MFTEGKEIEDGIRRDLTDVTPKPSHCQDLEMFIMGVQVSLCNKLIVGIGYCESQTIANEVFDPTEKCCICGGGEIMSQDLYDSIPEYELKCRDSNYRMVQSDPDYDVVDVKADVSKNGNVMVTSVTAIHKTNQ